MTVEQALKVISLNGKGNDIRCFFYSRKSKESPSHRTLIDNYKYHNEKHVLKINVSNFSLNEHEKNLYDFKPCEVLINQGEGQKLESLWLHCKFLEVKDRFIFVHLIKIKFKDNGNDITYPIQ